MRLIDADKLKEVWWQPETDMGECIRELIYEFDLNDVDDDVMAFSLKLLEIVNNFIDTEPTIDVNKDVNCCSYKKRGVKMKNIPKEKQICKWCEWYGGGEETEADMNDADICYQDIHEMVHADDRACPEFSYSDEFPRGG